jgi:hypothetical protein
MVDEDVLELAKETSGVRRRKAANTSTPAL